MQAGQCLAIILCTTYRSVDQMRYFTDVIPSGVSVPLAILQSALPP